MRSPLLTAGVASGGTAVMKGARSSPTTGMEPAVTRGVAVKMGYGVGLAGVGVGGLLG